MKDGDFMLDVKELLSELRVLTLAQAQATKDLITTRGLLANLPEKPKRRSE